MDINRFKKPNPNQDWFDWWLSDEPPAPSARQELRQKRVEQANTYQRRTVSEEKLVNTPATTNINININLPHLPSLKKLKVSRLQPPALPYKRIATITVLLAAAIGGSIVFYHNHQQKIEAAKLARAKVAAAVPARSSPSFVPLVPKDKPQLGDYSSKNKSIAYDGNRDTYSFIDILDANNLTVSEQPLPTGMGTTSQTIATIARQIGAKDPILLKNDTAYIKSVKNGGQTIVFSMKDLLVFINSPFDHPDEAYKAYIESLE
jgi:hypothetical protein